MEGEILQLTPPTPEDRRQLLLTISQFNRAVRWYLDQVVKGQCYWASMRGNQARAEVHRVTYTKARNLFPLHTAHLQMAQGTAIGFNRANVVPPIAHVINLELRSDAYRIENGQVLIPTLARPRSKVVILDIDDSLPDWYEGKGHAKLLTDGQDWKLELFRQQQDEEE